MALICFAVFEIYARNDVRRELHEKLDKIATTQAQVLSQPVWDLDREQIELILDALANDPDVAGATASDESGVTMASIGHLDTGSEELVTERDIVIDRNGKPRVIGKLAVALPDARLRDETLSRALLYGGLLALLVLAIVVLALIANRRVIGIPLARLLSSIESSSKGQASPQSVGMATMSWVG